MFERVMNTPLVNVFQLKPILTAVPVVTLKITLHPSRHLPAPCSKLKIETLEQGVKYVQS